MNMSSAITLLTINLVVLSVVIVALLVVIIVLVVKLNKIASNVHDATAHIASITEWFSPVKVFSEIAGAFHSFRHKKDK